MADLFDEIANDLVAMLTGTGYEIVTDLQSRLGVDVQYGPNGSVAVRSNPGEYPRRETHRLQDSIEHHVDAGASIDLIVDTDCPYSVYLEPSRLQMAPTFDAWADEVFARVADKVQNP